MILISCFAILFNFIFYYVLCGNNALKQNTGVFIHGLPYLCVSVKLGKEMFTFLK